MKRRETNISEFKGLTFASIEGKVGDYEIKFTTDDGRKFLMYHDQDCCEDVSVEDITGDLQDLVGSPILLAEEVTYAGEDPEVVKNSPEIESRSAWDSFTWTFYKLATIKGYVDIRWYGESNGYYSEDVSLFEINKEAEKNGEEL
jgi:hypothetical protein